MTASIPSGSEVEYCRFVVAPPEGLWVNRDEVRYSEGSHHFLLYETQYEEIPTHRNDGTPVADIAVGSDIFDCSEGPTNGWSITRLVGGSQNFDGSSAVRFPEDVALRVRPNAVLMMNAHYLNTSPAPLDASVNINLWTIPKARVKHEGDILFWYNIFIKVPEMARTDARMRCTVPEDVTFTTMQSHMHSRGVGFEAVTNTGERLYESAAWENVPVSYFDEGLPVTAGTVIDYRCAYQNNEGRTVFQGPRSTDEMCMLIGAFYPTVPGLSFCSADPADPMGTNSLGAEWVGNGSASCADTITCVQEGFSISDERAFFNHLQSCVVDSDEAVSPEVSAAVSCFLMAGQDAVTACSEELQACFAK